jgi:hypothetical protein
VSEGEPCRESGCHPDDRVRETLIICGRGACTYLQQILDPQPLRHPSRNHRVSFRCLPIGQALSWNTSLLLATDLKLICKEKNASVKMLVRTKFWEEYGQYGTYNGSGLIRDSLRRLYERGLFRRKHWTNCRRLLASAIISQRISSDHKSVIINMFRKKCSTVSGSASNRSFEMFVDI